MKAFMCLGCAVAIFAGAMSAYAGPVDSELKSSRRLAVELPASSRVGGIALSPDGTTLLCIAEQRDDTERVQFWVFNDINRLDSEEITGRPWEMDLSEQVTHVIDDEDAGGPYRNIDWSPDGQRVLFVRYGRLYIAELSDLKSRKNSFKAIDEVREAKAPRWSPDGARVAFLSPRDDSTPLNRVQVLTLASSEQKTLALDAVPASFVWQQPWSPDGNFIAYSSMKVAPNANSANVGGVSIVSADGESTRSLVDRDMTFSPAWRPEGDRIAYIGAAQGQALDTMSMLIYTCDAKGKDAKIAGASPVSEEKLAAVSTEIKDSLAKILKEAYPGIFSDDQLEAVSKLQGTNKEVVNSLWLAQCKLSAEIEGGEFQWRMNAAMKQLKTDLSNLADCASIARRAVEALPEEKRKSIEKTILSRGMEVMQPLAQVVFVHKAPTWSPDGSRLLFVRSSVGTGKHELVIADVKNGRSTVIFESVSIDNVSWAENGKKVLLRAERESASGLPGSGAGLEELIMAQVLNLTNEIGHPEIWLLEPK